MEEASEAGVEKTVRIERLVCVRVCVCVCVCVYLCGCGMMEHE